MRFVWAVVAFLVVLSGASCGEDDEPAVGPPDDEQEEEAVDVEDPVFRTDCPSPVDQAVDADLELAATAVGAAESGGFVGWRLVVANRGDSAVTLVFPSSQPGDVILEEGGQEVWKWSDDKLFAQAIRCADIAAGGAVAFELEATPLEVEPGEYERRAVITASPAPDAAIETITVEPAD